MRVLKFLILYKIRFDIPNAYLLIPSSRIDNKLRHYFVIRFVYLYPVIGGQNTVELIITNIQQHINKAKQYLNIYLLLSTYLRQDNVTKAVIFILHRRNVCTLHVSM